MTIAIWALALALWARLGFDLAEPILSYRQAKEAQRLALKTQKLLNDAISGKADMGVITRQTTIGLS
jgi:hypothetical protein